MPRAHIADWLVGKSKSKPKDGSYIKKRKRVSKKPPPPKPEIEPKFSPPPKPTPNPEPPKPKPQPPKQEPEPYIPPDLHTRLWVDKYTPCKKIDLVGNQKAYGTVEKWIRRKTDPKNKNPIKPLLVSGPPGCGKTSGITILLQDLGYLVENFNASDTRSAAGLGIVKSFLETKSNPFLQKSNTKPTKRAAILDECDGLYIGDKSNTIEFLKDMMGGSKTLLILICNDRYCKAVRQLSEFCELVSFYTLRHYEIVSKLTSIVRSEKLSPKTDMIAKIASAACGDLRSAINNLQFLYQQSTATVGDIRYDRGGSMSVALWDRFRNVVNLSKPLNDRASQFETCPDLLVDFAVENYWKECVDLYTQQPDLRKMAGGADILSESFTMRESPYNSLFPLSRKLGGFRSQKIDFPQNVKTWTETASRKKMMRSVLGKLNLGYDPSQLLLAQKRLRTKEDFDHYHLTSAEIAFVRKYKGLC